MGNTFESVSSINTKKLVKPRVFITGICNSNNYINVFVSPNSIQGN